MNENVTLIETSHRGTCQHTVKAFGDGGGINQCILFISLSSIPI